MNKKLRRNGFQLNNRGVGLVTVLIAVAFLIVLGSIVLFTSYNGLRSRTSARTGEERFYDAETAINEIQLGLQKAAAEAYSEAYSEVLKNYSETDTDIATFDAALKAAFAEKLSLDYNNNHYTIQNLQDLVTTENITVSNAAANTATPTIGDIVVTQNDDKQTVITFKSVSATSNVDVRKSTVSADLVVTLPKFSHYLSQYTLTGVPSYSIVCADKMSVYKGKSATISDSAYAGSVTVSEQSSLTVNEGILVSGGNINLEQGSKFTSNEDSTLWLSSFVLKQNSSLSLAGQTNVSNDLKFNGSGASAVLTGKYFGFGRSTSSASSSSSILFNNTNCTLDLQNVKQLSLAGYAFIDAVNSTIEDTLESAGLSIKDVRLGESMSVRSNQSIYLAPAESVRYEDEGTLASVSSNPVVVNDAALVKKMLNASLRTTDELLAGASVKAVAIPESGQWVVYFFLEFTKPAEANQYFKNYFTNNYDKLEEYIASYANVTKLKTSSLRSSTIQTTGYTFSNAQINSDGAFEASDLSLNNYLKTTTDLTTEASRRSAQYTNLKRALSTYSVSDTNEDTKPYSYIVNTSAVSQVDESPKTFENDKGEIVAVVVNGNFYYNSDNQKKYPKLKVIIASENVRIYSNFSGMILCGGDLSIRDNIKISSDSDAVSRAMSATYTNEDETTTKLQEYLNISLGTSSGTNTTAADTSSVADVQIVNWKKD